MKKTSVKKLQELASKVRMVVFDFDGVFTDNRVLVSEDGKESVFCNRSDGLGIERLKKTGIPIVVLSKEVNPVVSARCHKLKIRCVQGCSDKLEWLKNESEKIKIPMGEMAYLGNDINDIECLKKVGLPACVKDAYPEVIAVSSMITKKPGGLGAVREFCDWIINAHEKKA